MQAECERKVLMRHTSFHFKALVLLLAVSSAASCIPIASSLSPSLTPSQPTAPTSADTRLSPVTSTLSSYAFPMGINPSARYLFYIHGKIIEDQGVPAFSPDFGEYNYEGILEAFQRHGFVVVSEQRPKNTDVKLYTQRLVNQVENLIDAGVPPSSVTVVGASKGAVIAALASNLIRHPDLNYVLLGSCHPDMIRDWIASGATLSGNVLSIYDFADDEFSGSCKDLFTLSEGRGLGRHAEIVLQVGMGHGVLYQPHDEWILPAVQWANPAP